MSLHWSTFQLLLALFCGVLVTVLIVANLRSITVPVAVALMVAAFVGFKEGFVRQPRHVVFFFLVIFLIAAAVTRLSVDRRRFMVGLTCVLLSAFALDIVNQHEGYPGPAASTFSPAAFEEHVSSLIGTLRSSSEVAEAFASGLAADRLPDAVRSEIGARTVEALPWESAAVFANGFNWQPDPVFQAYSAYTPSLDELNATHLEKNGAAHVLYTWGDIDGRYLLWDQPAANRVLLCRYRVNERLSSPVFTKSGTPMLLWSRTSQRCGEPEVGKERRFSWNQEIPVQGGAGLTFAKISIRYSILGRLMETLFRIPRVYVKVYGVDGAQVASYRIVEDTADDGVLVSPFPQSLLEFKNTLQRAGDVKPIRSFVDKSSAAYLFDSDIKVRFASVRYR